MAGAPAGTTTAPEGDESAAEWHIPAPEVMPQSTYWPFILSLGIILVLWGIVINLIMSAVGLVVLLVALSGWIGVLRSEGEAGVNPSE